MNKKFINSIILVILFNALLLLDLQAEECKIKVGYVINPIIGIDRAPWDDEELEANFFKIQKNSSKTTDLQHMRNIRNTGDFDVEIHYWNITGDHKETIKKR